MKSDDNEHVGYGKPPKATQFRKGQSGNPKGRSKGSTNGMTAILQAMGAKVVIHENGRRRTVTKLKAAMMQLANKAAGGDLRACKQVSDLVRLAEDQVQQENSTKTFVEEADQKVLQSLLKKLEIIKEEDQ